MLNFSARAAGAAEGTRRACRYALPVMGVGYLLLLLETCTVGFLHHGLTGLILGFLEGTSLCLLMLAIWLGSAAIVGWLTPKRHAAPLGGVRVDTSYGQRFGEKGRDQPEERLQGRSHQVSALPGVVPTESQ